MVVMIDGEMHLHFAWRGAHRGLGEALASGRLTCQVVLIKNGAINSLSLGGRRGWLPEMGTFSCDTWDWNKIQINGSVSPDH